MNVIDSRGFHFLFSSKMLLINDLPVDLIGTNRKSLDISRGPKWLLLKKLALIDSIDSWRHSPLLL